MQPAFISEKSYYREELRTSDANPVSKWQSFEISVPIKNLRRLAFSPAAKPSRSGKQSSKRKLDDFYV